MTYSLEHHIGDTIYALAFLKKIGAERLVFYNGASGFMTRKIYNFVSPLFESQKFIKNVAYSPFDFPTPLAGFRYWLRWFSLPECFFYAYGESKEVALKFIRENTWIDDITPKFKKRIIVNRTGRYYKSNYFKNLTLFDQSEVGFVGFDYEYDNFIRDSGLKGIDYLPISNLLEMAQIIQGADLLVGEVSSPVAIAQALGKPCLAFCTDSTLRSVNCMKKTTMFSTAEEIDKLRLFSFLSENEIKFNADALVRYDKLFPKWKYS